MVLLIGIYIGINLSSVLQAPSSVSTRGADVIAVDKLKSENDLSKSQADVKRWREKYFQTLEEKAQDAIKADKAISDAAVTEKNPNKHPLCQRLPHLTPSATALWTKNINDILKSSQLLPNDLKYKFHDFTAQLLQLITPRLSRSIKSLPYDWKSVERALTIGYKRYEYLQLSTEEQAKVSKPPRPLKIVVMGGSLLVGTNCRTILRELDLQMRMPKRECTWSNRLGNFFNLWAGGDLVQVTKVAMGGTNTATGGVIFEYDLIPEEAREPDIVINAYSTNDMHVLTILEAETSNITLRDRVFEMTQDYVRKVLDSCSNPPLLIHFDDYLGNEQRKIWDTTELAQGIQVLANYYGFVSISYADVVRDLVYGDNRESWFSSDWWSTGKYDREIHPGMGMHISATLVAVYGMLNLATEFCSLPSAVELTETTEYQPAILGLPSLKHDVKQAKGKPKLRPNGLPPPLTKALLIEDVTPQWRNATLQKACSSFDTTKSSVKCPFSWVSGLSLQQNNRTWVQEYFQRRAGVWEGWELSEDGEKRGFVPTKHSNSSHFSLYFSFKQPIRSITVFMMRSYGEKWANSRLRVDVHSSNRTGDGTWQALATQEMVGFHAKNTSETYTEPLSLSHPVDEGSKLRIRARLIGGSTFKIMGLAICS